MWVNRARTRTDHEYHQKEGRGTLESSCDIDKLIDVLPMWVGAPV